MLKFSPSDFLLNVPLYTKMSYEFKNQLNEYLVSWKIKDMDGYNPVQKIVTTFSAESNNSSTFVETAIYNHLQEIQLTCKRTGSKFNFYLFWNQQEKYIMKIGQYPSVADFQIDQVKQYDKLLNKEKLREFTKAIGLAANGVGIGSFVYLRRIFEDLIYEAYGESVKKHGELAEFNKKRMAEKIDALHDFLPEFLVENKELYGILSKGIHELDEKDCLTHFDTVKVGIEMILDEKLEQLNKKKKAEAARLKIQQAASAISKQEPKP